MGHQVLPNVFLAGVRRCGTTSVFRWLNDHPSVCTSSEKGTEFLMDRDSPFLKQDSNYHDHGLKDYGEYFLHHAGESIILDATTRYYSQETPRRVLSDFDPRPQVLFLLRDPADRLYSEFRYLKNNRQKLNAEMSFAEFVDSIETNRIDDALAREARPDSERAIEKLAHETRNALGDGRYIEFLIPWREALGSDHVHVYLFEELTRNAGPFMQRVARDIGIDSSFYADYRFTKFNGSLCIRNKLVHRCVRGLKTFLPKTKMSRRIYSTYLQLQNSPHRQSEEDKAALVSLRSYFRPFNEQLSSEFGIDLERWEKYEMTAR